MDVLIINGNNYTQYIQRKGVAWSRNDLDSEKTTRTKDGTMRRYRIATKRKLSYTMCHMSRSVMAQLDSDLDVSTLSVTYRDLHGTQTRTFYCSSFSATMESAEDDSDAWGSATFDLVEV